jgi:uncharacterized protein (TIGR00290 family)
LHRAGTKISKKTLLSWSSGKDSAWVLHALRQDPEIELAGLFTVMNEKYERVSMHATRLDLLRLQAKEAGLPIQLINLPDACPFDKCDAIMRQFVTDAAVAGVKAMAFGDLYLEDVRRYREKNLEGTGIEPLFPIWGIPTSELAERMFLAGLEAYVSSVDLSKLPVRFAGRKWTRELIAEMPEGCDPCGENGEIHTVVTAGPMFRRAIPVRVGEILERCGFAYADIILQAGEGAQGG